MTRYYDKDGNYQGCSKPDGEGGGCGCLLILLGLFLLCVAPVPCAIIFLVFLITYWLEKSRADYISPADRPKKDNNHV
jgi:hypothetical protein